MNVGMIDGKIVSRFDILNGQIDGQNILQNIYEIDQQNRRNGVGLACTRQQLETSNLDMPPGE